MPIDDLTALGQKMREARKEKRPDTTGACGSEPCFCKANRQYRKGKNESIGKGPAHLFRYAYKSRCFSGR